MATHGKIYASKEEREDRFNTFQSVYDQIKAQDSNTGYKLGINRFSDMSSEAFLE